MRVTAVGATVTAVSDAPALPPSDGDREAVVARLTALTGTGHLTLAEFDERARQAYAAASHAELAVVTADISATAVTVPVRRRPRRWVGALLGGSTVAGRWRLNGRLTSVSVLGGSTLDLRNVELDGGEATITTLALLGGDDIYVPDGVEVEVTGFAVIGGHDEHGPATAVRPGAPVVRIRAFAFMGGCDVWRVPSGAAESSLKAVRKRIKHLGR